ncbi:MAG: hypothetical protein IJW82_04820 [Clostridia bacterium]|nr:hypothetical protein [Clostridia bacterium]
MGLIEWIFKSKKEMSKPDTKWVKLGKYNITSHAQNRIVDKKRNLTKSDMLINLYGKNSKNSDYYKRDGAMQYDRVNEDNRTLTHITKKEKNVKSIQKFHNNKQGRKTAYKNFKRR